MKKGLKNDKNIKKDKKLRIIKRALRITTKSTLKSGVQKKHRKVIRQKKFKKSPVCDLTNHLSPVI
jgi:hypothetical protein